MINIKKVTIVGANGRIGYQVAALIALQTSAKIYLISRSLEKSKLAVENAIKSVNDETIRSQLFPSTYENLSESIKDSEWVYESVAEIEELKFSIHGKISNARLPGTIVSTGTSGFSISKLATCYSLEGQALFFGTHFFNPLKMLPLLEFIKCENTNNLAADQFRDYLETILLRKVIITKDRPAFLANRIGFTFLNEITHYVEKYKGKGGVDYIDTILGPETGRNMSPLNTIDYIGLDVHAAIVDNLRKNDPLFFPSELVIPEYLRLLINKGLLGRKTHGGFYKMTTSENGLKKKYTYSLLDEEYHPSKIYPLDFSLQMKNLIDKRMYKDAFESLVKKDSEQTDICLYFLIKYMLISLISIQGVEEDLFEIDTAMSFGFGWVPPTVLFDLLGGYANIKNIIKNRPFINQRLINYDLSIFDINSSKQENDFALYFRS